MQKTRTAILAVLFPLVAIPAHARPLEDQVAELIRAKIAKCNTVAEVARIDSATFGVTAKCPKGIPHVGPKKEREICQKILEKNASDAAQEREKQTQQVLKDACVIDAFSFVAAGPIQRDDQPLKSESYPVVERKRFWNCTSSPKEYLETISLRVQNGYRVVLDEAYSSSISEAEKVSFSEVASKSATTGTSVGASYGASVSVNDSTTASKTVSKSRDWSSISKVEVSLANSNTQETLTENIETRPLQLTIAPMTMLEVTAQRITEDVTYRFAANVRAEARIRVPDRLRAKPIDEFTADGQAYLSELIPPDESSFPIQGVLTARQSTTTETFYKEEVMTLAKCAEVGG